MFLLQSPIGIPLKLTERLKTIRKKMPSSMKRQASLYLNMPTTDFKEYWLTYSDSDVTSRVISKIIT